jgi:CRISPR system Cascade subunit CasD
VTVLLLRLEGPMQAWGLARRFPDRDTALEPTLSGVVGLLGAALGRDRSEDISDLAALRMGVRVDREGTRFRDFQTADGGKSGRPGRPGEMVLSNAWYLSGASFLAGLEGDAALLGACDQALGQPRWPLCLGRRSCSPSVPIRAGLREGPLLAVLCREPWPFEAEDPPQLRLVVTAAEGEPRMDVPLSFAEGDRRFGLRHVRHDHTPALR